MGNIYEDSFVQMYWGPRRGGKSASMAYDCASSLLAGKRVFADSPVAFNFQLEEDGPIYHYATEPLDYVELIMANEDKELKKKYMGSLVAWDEVDKWMFSRNFQSVFSKIISQFVTLIGKLEMSFVLTAQFMHLVDKNIRMQVDAECRCVDLSFKYTQLQRGSTIGQTWMDKSGRMTGTEYDYDNETYQQTFFAKIVWDIYDTKRAPSLAEALQKVEIRQQKKIITIGDIEGAREPAEKYKFTQKENNEQVIDLLATEAREIQELGLKPHFSKQEIYAMARERGFHGTDYVLANVLANHNFSSVGINKVAVLV